MSFKQTIREYWRSTYFLIGMTLIIMGLVLYNVIAMRAMSAPWDQMLYWLNISTYALILPLVGTLLCAYGFYRVIMTD